MQSLLVLLERACPDARGCGDRADDTEVPQATGEHDQTPPGPARPPRSPKSVYSSLATGPQGGRRPHGAEAPRNGCGSKMTAGVSSWLPATSWRASADIRRWA